jgi:Cytochrome c oxidase subunit IV
VKVEVRVFLGITAFFVVIGIGYWFASYDEAGAIMLAACALMGSVAGGAIWLLARRAPELVGDRPDATIADGRGPVGVFPTRSVWPFAVGASGALFASGFAFGPWLAFPAAGALALAIVGYVLETRNTTLPGEEP